MFKILAGALDNPKFEEILHLLKTRGFQLEEIGKQENLIDTVMERSKTDPPDLILLDPDLPEKQGMKLCKHLKNNPHTETIPIVFLHCHNGQDHQVVESLQSGANDFIHDPDASEEVLARIHAAIRTKMTLTKSKALADQLNQVNMELYERNLAVEKELYTTRQLQQSLLPPILVEPEKEETPQFAKCHFHNDKLRISGIYMPCDALGGDIYDVIKFSDDAMGVAIADVSGHGVPAAFVTAIFKSSFYRATHSFKKPSDILYHLNNELVNIVKTGHYVTGVYCRLEPQENGQYKLLFSGAGHPYPFYYSAKEQAIIRLEENGTPLAWFKDMDYPLGEILLSPGDKVLMFTDGISEMKNPHHELYGEDELGKLFFRHLTDPAGLLMDGMLTELSDFAQGHPLDDDLSLVLIEAL